VTDSTQAVPGRLRVHRVDKRLGRGGERPRRSRRARAYGALRESSESTRTRTPRARARLRPERGQGDGVGRLYAGPDASLGRRLKECQAGPLPRASQLEARARADSDANLRQPAGQGSESLGGTRTCAGRWPVAVQTSSWRSAGFHNTHGSRSEQRQAAEA
jgi:hypothetical protein